jgi:hypothetical protein
MILSLIVGMIDDAPSTKEVARKRGQEKSQKKGNKSEKYYRVHRLTL